MSRKTARAAIVARFQPGTVPGIGSAYRSHPKRAVPRMFSPTGAASGAILVPRIVSSHESRVAMGGPTSGKKRVDYTVDLEVFFRSSKRSAEDAMDDFDDTIDALIAYVRADRTLASTDVWQFGEGPTGIDTRAGNPGLVGEITTIWAAVTCVLTEWITS